MAIKVQTYQPRVKARPKSSGGPVLQNAIQLDDAGVRTARNLAQVGQSLGTMQANKEREAWEIQVATDILDESTAYSNAVREFEAQYTETNKGKDARGAAQAYEDFHRQQFDQRSQRFAGMDARTQLLWKRNAEQVRQSSLNRAGAYAKQQDQIYRDDTTKARASLFLNKLPGMDDKRVAEMGRQLSVEIDALNPGRDMTAYKNQLAQQTALTRINSALATKDYSEAERLLALHKDHLGTGYDEAARGVEVGRVRIIGETYEDMAHAEGAGAAMKKLMADESVNAEDRREIRRLVRAVGAEQDAKAAERKQEFVNSRLETASDALDSSNYAVVEKQAQDLKEAGQWREAKLLRDSIGSHQALLAKKEDEAVKKQQESLYWAAMDRIDNNQMTRGDLAILKKSMPREKFEKLSKAYDGTIEVTTATAKSLYKVFVSGGASADKDEATRKKFTAFHDYMVEQSELLGRNDAKTLNDLAALYVLDAKGWGTGDYSSARADGIRFVADEDEMPEGWEYDGSHFVPGRPAGIPAEASYGEIAGRGRGWVWQEAGRWKFKGVGNAE